MQITLIRVFEEMESTCKQLVFTKTVQLDSDCIASICAASSSISAAQ